MTPKRNILLTLLIFISLNVLAEDRAVTIGLIGITHKHVHWMFGSEPRNWLKSWKELEVYGLNGVIYTDNRHDLSVRLSEGYYGNEEQKMKLEEWKTTYDDPLALLATVFIKEAQLNKFDHNFLEKNIIVVEILNAARKSATSNKTIRLK